MTPRTLATLTDADVKHRRTITLGTLTGRLVAVIPVLNRVSVEVDCGEVRVVTYSLPGETPVEVRS